MKAQTEFKLIKKDFDLGWKHANLAWGYNPKEAGCVHSYNKGYNEMCRP